VRRLRTAQPQVVERRGLLYQLNSTQRLPPTHELLTLPLTAAGARSALWLALLSPHALGGNAPLSEQPRRHRLPSAYLPLLPCFHQVLKRIRRLHLLSVLDRHCPLRAKPASLTREQLLASHLSYGAVTSFLCAAVDRVVPLALWGSDRNRRRVHAAILRVVRLRRRESALLELLSARMV
jgi:Telomerase ribonucleoprotein complex - RNA binding domain